MEKVDKDVLRKSKVKLKKDSATLNCAWSAAQWLGQYSKILETVRPVASVR